MSILDVFLRRAAESQDHVAIIDGAGVSITFGALAARAASLAASYAGQGIVRGDRVLVAMPVGIDLYASLAALWWLGASVVFPEPALGLAGLRHAITSVKPRAFLSSGVYRLLRFALPALWRIPINLSPTKADRETPISDPLPLHDNDPALITFTSGSTGKPKAIARSHGFLMAQNEAVSPLLRSQAGDERDLVAFPVFVLVNLGLGTTSVLPNWALKRPDAVSHARLSAHIRRQGVTRLLIPPILCELLCAGAGADLSPVRAVFTGGGPLYPDIARGLMARHPEISLTIVYGSTEAEPIAHVDVDEIGDGDWQAMAQGGGLLAGVPVPPVSLQLIDDEIVVCGDHVNKTYLDPADNISNKLTLEDRIWHRTGDAGRLDASGRLWLLGRHRDTVAGLHPFSVEVAARGWPGVRKAALCRRGDVPVLAIAGDASNLPNWRAAARLLGIDDVRPVRRMPMDRRHRSKIDMNALNEMLR